MIQSLRELGHWLGAMALDLGSYRISLLDLVRAAIIIVVLYAAFRLLLRSAKWLLRRNGALDETQRLLIEKLIAVALITLMVLIGIDAIGIDLTALTVFSGAFGLAIGFGLQKTIGNLIAGIILLMDRSIKPGDVIAVGDSTTGASDLVANVGRVQRIGVRAVSVVTRDGKKHLIPNELLMTERVENWSYSSRDVRVRMRVPVPYDADLRQAQALMLAAARANPRVLAEPEPMVWITAFGERAVDHELRIWIAVPEAGLGNVQGEVFLAIWDAFQQAGITIPSPRLAVSVSPALPDDQTTSPQG